MQNHMMNSLTRLVPTFGLAALMAGCSTMSQPTEQSCMVGHEVKNELFLAFVLKANSPDQYSVPCNEGKTAAQTTYIGQDAKGNLHPTGAMFALEFNKDVQNKIKASTETGDKDTHKFYQDVSNFFGFYLNKFGGMTIDKIQKYVEDLKAEQDTPTPTPEAPKLPPRCKPVAGVIRSCTPEQ